MLKQLLLSFVLLMLTSTNYAEPLKPDQVPEPLKPWVDWVLQDDDKRTCPYLFNQASQTCAWPSTLTLTLTEQGGLFLQTWQVYKPSWIRLPGNSQQWPQNVRTASGLLTVTQKNGYPAVKLKAGTHTLQGEFTWQRLPESLYVTPQAGLVSLMINGETITPNLDRQGKLWLKQRKTSSSAEDNLDIQVFRKIIDAHPIQVETHIQLQASGKQRNVVLSPVMLEGFIPLSIESPLASRIENGKLHLQLRPGQWTLTVMSRAKGNVTEFALPKSQAPWPSQEAWVYQNNPNSRQVKVEGVPSIDPNQTGLPNSWKSLPTYLLDQGQSLSLKTLHRGLTHSQRDKLNLNRQLWLDFDGKGYTFQDKLNGHIFQPNRLNVNASLALGRVSLNGQAQFITQADESGTSGVEVRQQRVNLEAEGRFTGKRNEPPVNGWQHDLDQVNTTLHLPPGWTLFSSSGTDNLPKTWLEQWSLLDLFLVMLVALAIGYLYNWVWAGFALLTLVLVWHQADAPRFIWLNILAVTALLRVLPQNRFKTVINYYRGLSFLALALIVLPYTINTLRLALYPQLEHYTVGINNGMHNSTSRMVDEADNIAMDMMVEEAAPIMAQEMVQNRQAGQAPMTKSMPAPPRRAAPKRYAQRHSETSSYNSKLSKNNSVRYKKAPNLNQLDPDSLIQTGPGLPNWQWNQVHLRWSGPVKADESSSLWLLSPFITACLRVLGVLLLLVLCWRLLAHATQGMNLPKALANVLAKLNPSTKSSAAMWLLLPVLLLAQPDSQARDLPNEAMLNELKQRLLAQPDCLPQCAQIEKMNLVVDHDLLRIRLKVHASTDTAIPLPGSQATWLAEEVWLNDKPALALKRDNSQQLWLVLPKGIHTVMLKGKLAKRNQVFIPLPLKPHQATWQGVKWTLEGIKDTGVPDKQLTLTRIQDKTAKADKQLANDQLPPFLHITRRINLGLEWTVDTTIQRQSKDNVPISVQLPLLTGEQPLSENIRVKNGIANVNLNIRQRQLQWTSRLKKSEVINLKAANNPDFIERWQLAVSPIWHTEQKGIPANALRQEANSLVSTWQPWPNETLALTITRPKGVAGQQITVLSSHTRIKTGKRANDVQLDLSMRSSRGTQHKITLPEGVALRDLAIGGRPQSIQQKDNILTLQLSPGQQNINMSWQEDEPISTRYRFPPLDLGLPSVNNQYMLHLAQDRWVLWVNGPSLGPAVLIWGVLLALLLLSLALGYSNLTPLATWQWFLLAIGLSQTSPYLMVLVVLWLMAIAGREKVNLPSSRWAFNGMQVSLALMTLVALVTLMAAVAQGLLGQPDMQITGNGSHASKLQWFADRSTAELAQPSIISVPLTVYRFLMLAWALWLAMTVLGWLRWGWQAISKDELWRAKVKSPKADKAAEATQEPTKPK